MIFLTPMFVIRLEKMKQNLDNKPTLKNSNLIYSTVFKSYLIVIFNKLPRHFDSFLSVFFKDFFPNL